MPTTKGIVQTFWDTLDPEDRSRFDALTGLVGSEEPPSLQWTAMQASDYMARIGNRLLDDAQWHLHRGLLERATRFFKSAHPVIDWQTAEIIKVPQSVESVVPITSEKIANVLGFTRVSGDRAYLDANGRLFHIQVIAENTSLELRQTLKNLSHLARISQEEFEATFLPKLFTSFPGLSHVQILYFKPGSSGQDLIRWQRREEKFEKAISPSVEGTLSMVLMAGMKPAIEFFGLVAEPGMDFYNPSFEDVNHKFYFATLSDGAFQINLVEDLDGEKQAALKDLVESFAEKFQDNFERSGGVLPEALQSIRRVRLCYFSKIICEFFIGQGGISKGIPQKSPLYDHGRELKGEWHDISEPRFSALYDALFSNGDWPSVGTDPSSGNESPKAFDNTMIQAGGTDQPVVPNEVISMADWINRQNRSLEVQGNVVLKSEALPLETKTPHLTLVEPEAEPETVGAKPAAPDEAQATSERGDEKASDDPIDNSLSPLSPANTLVIGFSGATSLTQGLGVFSPTMS